MAMKTKFNSDLTGFLISLFLVLPFVSHAQSEKAVIQKYLKELPAVPVSNALTKYRMTAIYTNMDFYGNLINKIKVSGDYTRGLENGNVQWNNVFISFSNTPAAPFPEGVHQKYMENMKYIPSSEMLDGEAFNNFPSGLETVFSKNLIWDMMAIEGFAWDYTDSLQPNTVYVIPDIMGAFAMADIGTYSHNEIQLCWTGISAISDELCAVIEFRALDNKINMLTEGMTTKGTEQYWGTIWISLKTKLVEYAVMYGGCMQEIEMKGIPEKFTSKAIRELWVDRIR